MKKIIFSSCCNREEKSPVLQNPSQVQQQMFLAPLLYKTFPSVCILLDFQSGNPQLVILIDSLHILQGIFTIICSTGTVPAFSVHKLFKNSMLPKVLQSSTYILVLWVPYSESLTHKSSHHHNHTIFIMTTLLILIIFHSNIML